MSLAKKWSMATIKGLQGTQNGQKGLKMTEKGLKMTYITLCQKLMKNNEILSSKL